jgi:hypothetical protein
MFFYVQALWKRGGVWALAWDDGLDLAKNWVPLGSFGRHPLVIWIVTLFGIWKKEEERRLRKTQGNVVNTSGNLAI